MESPRTGKKFKIGEAKFCPDSGMSLIEKEKVHIELSSPHPFDIEEYPHGCDEEMFHKPHWVNDTENHGIFILNFTTKYDVSIEGTGFCVIPENWIELKTEFEEEYKEYIELFRKQFGSCHVRYGVVNHAS